VVGAAIGAAGALLLDSLSPAVSRELASAAVLAFWALLTGALHEDGLADCFDAIRKGRSPQRSLEILKDSRIGAFGALALILVSLIRWQGLVQMAAAPLPVLIAAGALGRAAIVALAWTARPAGSATGALFASQLTTPGALLAIAFGLAGAALCGLRLAWSFVSLTVLIVFGARRFFHARLGGVTGDGLGATCLVVESAILVMASCRPCSW
jgi:adenosylcobinamide-GDP ribazoletransferase